MGLVAPSSYLAINSYFVSRRGIAMGICQAGIGLGFIAVPYLVEAMLHNYGFRGTMLLLGGISLNSIVGALLYQPVERHSILLRLHKVINREDEKGKRLVLSKRKMKYVIYHVTSRCHRPLSPFHLLCRASYDIGAHPNTVLYFPMIVTSTWPTNYLAPWQRQQRHSRT